MVRTLLVAVGLAFGVASAMAEEGAAHCAAFDGKTMTMIVGGAAGGGFDTYARLMAPVLETITGGQVIVTNVDAAGGRAALQALATAKPDGLTFGIISGSTLVLDDPSAGPDDPGLDDFAPLGTVYADTMTWIGRPGLDIAEGRDKPLVFGANFIETAILNSGMAAHALGLDYRFVPGYTGSSEFAAGALRGEIDLFSVSLESALRAARAGDLQIYLSLTDEPLPTHPEIPHLGGPDGVVATMLADDPQRREEGLRLASAIADIGLQTRSFMAPASIPEADLDCLESLVWEAMTHPKFAADAKEAKRTIAPRNAEETAALLARAVEAQEQVRELGKQILQQAQ